MNCRLPARVDSVRKTATKREESPLPNLSLIASETLVEETAGKRSNRADQITSKLQMGTTRAPVPVARDR